MLANPSIVFIQKSIFVAALEESHDSPQVLG